MKNLVALILAVTLIFSRVAAWGDGGKERRHGGVTPVI
ncbi:Uncharacterised protein [Mycobacteroides abscessus subsp. abscessus]|nr:Uncharacterised protein [Mycobacteroides abscessus subsp. abscessus]